VVVAFQMATARVPGAKRELVGGGVGDLRGEWFGLREANANAVPDCGDGYHLDGQVVLGRAAGPCAVGGEVISQG